jgi:hypothetical protein
MPLRSCRKNVFREDRTPRRRVYGIASLGFGAAVARELIFEVVGWPAAFRLSPERRDELPGYLGVVCGTAPMTPREAW